MRPATWPLLLAVFAASFVGACSNEVRSERPLFTARDSPGLPKFKAGLWLGVDKECEVDSSRPATQWPDCVTALVFGPKGLEAGYDNGRLTPLPKLLPYDMVFAGGDPIVVQYRTSKPEPGEPYRYMALGPKASDPDGQVTAVIWWPVVCGPLGAKGRDTTPSEVATRPVTTEPWPGLEVRGENCFARNPASVRFAAKASEAMADAPPTLRWLRAGRR